MSQEIHIYVRKKTSRIVYIFDQVIKGLLGLEYILIIDKEEFKAITTPKFNYSHDPMGDELFLSTMDLLQERGISEHEISFTEYRGLPAFFQVYNKKSALPFDLFAASFYLLSRYEEYLPFIKDQYGRFTAQDSLAYQKGFLEKPIVNIWTGFLRDILKEHCPTLEFKHHHFKFQPTLDIDSAWAIRHKGGWRIAGGLMQSLLNFNVKSFNKRISVLRGKENDPFDTFEYQFNLHRKYNLRPLYFILFAEYGKNDKNVPTHNKEFQELIRRIADYGDVGIHPSYMSNQISGKVKHEVDLLSKVLHRSITKSRQHFLILNMPGTYRQLLNLGITDDYTMGFASYPGFRASICTPFYFYDLEMEHSTPLLIHPFTIMEGTLCDYMHLSAEEALPKFIELIDEVKAVDGTFISLWHNESLSNQDRWCGWNNVYEQMIEYACQK